MEFEARDESVVKDSFVRIGADLNSARLEKRLQISELSQLLRISKHHLKSIEAGDFDSLPGSTYVAGYLRSFAKEVGLDGAVVAQRYRALLNDGEKDPSYSFPVDTQRPQRSGAMLASIIVIFAVMGYGGWYAVGKPDLLTALIGESEPEAVVLPQIELAVTEPDDMAKTDVEPVDLAAAVLPSADLSTADLSTADLANSSDAADGMVTNGAGAPADAVAPLPAPVTIAADTIEFGELVAEVPILEAAPAVEIDIAAISVDETSEETQPVTGTLADGAQSGAATPTGVLPTAALPTATLPGATMATSAGGTDLGAVEGALTTRPADDVVADQMATVTPDSTDAMDNTMSSQIGTGVAFARQRVPELEITLRAAGASWVEIIRNDGEEVMAKLMRDGDTYMVDSRDRLYLSTGNAGGLELVFNDGTVRSVGDPGEILRDLLLDATKLRNQF
jgi:cytoskeletal protein RodZ